LQILSVEAQNQALNNWFKEVIKSMEVVEVRRNRLYILDSPFFLDLSSLITSSVKEDLDTSWLTQVFIKPQKPVIKELKKQDPEEDKKVEKLQQELFEQKMLTEALKRQMAEMKEEQKAREEAQARRSEALEETVKKQSEDLKAMMIDMMTMMKKQQRPKIHTLIFYVLLFMFFLLPLMLVFPVLHMLCFDIIMVVMHYLDMFIITTML
jgi:DNA repair exonuclease SbcCD ATPase subunit